jgi:hypothetical protein
VRAALPVTLLILGLAAGCPAGTIRVPSDVARVEIALLMAAPHDTVLVAPGTYAVHLVWPATPGITLAGEAGPAATILDGGGTDTVVGIYTGVDTTTVVTGFTITRGRAEGY